MLKFTKITNIEMATIHGTVKVEEDGTVKGLTPEQEKSFANSVGFIYTEEKAPAKETKPTDSNSDEEVKKEPVKRTTQRKTAPKKTETDNK